MTSQLQNPFGDPDESPPPIPERSPDRLLRATAPSHHQRRLNRPRNDLAEIVQQPTDHVFSIPGSESETGTSDNTSIDPTLMSGANQESDGYNSEDFAPPTQEQIQRNNPYIYTGFLPAKITEESVDEDGTVRSKRSIGGQSTSQETESTVDRTYVHSFPPHHSLRRDPFADPVDRTFGANISNEPYHPSPLGKGSPTTPLKNTSPNLSGTIAKIQKLNQQFNLSPVKESPPTTVSHNIRFGLRRLSPRSRDNTPTKEQKLLRTAILQSHLLEEERRKTAEAIFAEVPRLYPSPRGTPNGSLRRVGLGERDFSTSSTRDLVLGPYAGGIEEEGTITHYPDKKKKKLMLSTTFWIFFGLINVSLVSTGAAFAVLFRGKSPNGNIHATPGTVVWLSISVGGILLGVIGCIFVWGMRNPRFIEFVRHCGFEELGLLPKFEERVQRTERERQDEQLRFRERQARIKEREAKLGGRASTIASIRTNDPEWQALYSTPTPQQLRHEFGPYGRQRGLSMRNEPGLEMEILIGQTVKKTCLAIETTKRESAGVDSMLSGGTPLREFNEQDIGMQVLSPTRERQGLGYNPETYGPPPTLFHSKSRSHAHPAPHTSTTPTQSPNHPLVTNQASSERFPFSKFRGRKVTTDESFLPAHLRERKDPPELIIKPLPAAPEPLLPPQPEVRQREIAKHLSQDFHINNTPVLPTSHPDVSVESLTASSGLTFPTFDGSLPQQGELLSTPRHSKSTTVSHSPTTDFYISMPASSRFPSDPGHEHIHGVRVADYSPLESLARELNTAEIRSLGRDQRADYFSSQRSLTEERDRKVRASLEKDVTKSSTKRASTNFEGVPEDDEEDLKDESFVDESERAIIEKTSSTVSEAYADTDNDRSHLEYEGGSIQISPRSTKTASFLSPDSPGTVSPMTPPPHIPGAYITDSEFDQSSETATSIVTPEQTVKEENSDRSEEEAPVRPSFRLRSKSGRRLHSPFPSLLGYSKRESMPDAAETDTSSAIHVQSSRDLDDGDDGIKSRPTSATTDELLAAFPAVPTQTPNQPTEENSPLSPLPQTEITQPNTDTARALLTASYPPLPTTSAETIASISATSTLLTPEQPPVPPSPTKLLPLTTHPVASLARSASSSTTSSIPPILPLPAHLAAVSRKKLQPAIAERVQILERQGELAAGSLTVATVTSGGTIPTHLPSS